LSPAIRAAILEETGELGLLLALAKAAEVGDEATLVAACEAIKMEFSEVTEFDLQHVGELNLTAAAWITEHAHS